MKASFEHVEDYLEQADDLKPEQFSALRAQAANDLQQFGFPALKTESWKYTHPKKLLKTVYEPVKAKSVSREQIASFLLKEAYYIVLVNGQLDSSLSTFPDIILNDQNVKLGSIIPMAQTGFSALNALLFSQAITLNIKTKLDKPIQILHVAANVDAEEVIYSRLFAQMMPEAFAKIVEQFVSLDKEDAYWRNHAAEFELQQGARLSYYQVVQEAKNAQHTNFVASTQAENACFSSFSLDLSGQLIRHDLQTNLNAKNACTHLHGLYLACDTQHVDNHTVINHNHAYTFSDEFYKGIVDDKAHAVFNGRVYVAKDAQKIDSVQRNANLMLSKDSEIDTKPELEIYADDVKCAHGATVGQLDKKALFYLQTRGIDLEMAQKLLTYGFAYELVEEVKDKTLHNFFTNLLALWFVNDKQLQELML